MELLISIAQNSSIELYDSANMSYDDADWLKLSSYIRWNQDFAGGQEQEDEYQIVVGLYNRTGEILYDGDYEGLIEAGVFERVPTEMMTFVDFVQGGPFLPNLKMS